MEQKFYSTVEAADKAGITGAPTGVGKTFRRLAAKLGLVPTKEKGALCWTEADIAEVKANYKPRAKRTATVETPAISANNNETDGSENIIDAPNDEVVTTAQVGEPTLTLSRILVDVPPANTGNTIDMTLYNTFMLWAEKISNGQHDAVYPFVAKLKEVFAFDADKEEIIDAIKTDDVNGARRYLAQFNFVATNEAGYLYKLVADNNGEVVLVDLPAANSIPADVVVPTAEETDDREVVSENTPAADTLPAPMDKPPADVQSENADETEGVLGKKIMPAAADQSTASKETAEINIHGNDSTNGGVKQHLWRIPAEILALPRWLKTRDDNPKAPVVSKWQLPENQKPAAELNGIIGFVAATEAEGGLIFYDLDHCLTEEETFVNAKAEMWFNTITQGGKFYAEKSQSKHGVHSFAVPTEGKFLKSTGRLYLTEDKTAFIEVFYGTNKFCLPTGDTIRCPYHDAPIAKGEVADTIFQAVLDAIAAQNAKAQPKQEGKPKPARAQDYLSDNPEYDLWRAARMLDCIEPARLTDDNDWLAVISAAKNIGLPYAVIDSWNRRDTDRYNERENLSRWNSIKPSSDFDIETLHGIAKRFLYSESDTRREWHDLRGIKPARRPTNNGTQSKLRDCPIDLVIPENFIFNQRGITFEQIGKKDAPPRKIVVARTPIVPTRIFRDVTSGTVRYEVGIKFRGQWRRTETDGRTLTDPRNVLSLAGTGALITEPKLICRYFADIINDNDNLPEVKSFNKPGWYKINGTEQFIYPTGDSGVDGYVVRRSNIAYDDLFSVEGNPEEWKNTFRHVLSRSVIHRTVIGASLAAPLLKILGEPNFCLHVEGTSNYAKSPLVKFALSVYGDPTEGQLFRTFDATAKNLITMAAGFNDFPQAIDEAESMSKRAYEEFSKTVYDFAAGVINQANLRNGNVRKAEKFRGVRISTGERPLLKITDKKGAFKRLITIHVDKPLFTDKEAVALHRFCERNHGHFGRLWTEYIAANRDRIVADFDILLDNAQEGALAKQIDGAAVRAVTACTVAFWHFRLCLGLYKNFEYQDAARDIESILRGLPTKDQTSDLTRGISLLASWIDEHPKNFIQAGDKSGTEISAVSFTETSGVIFADGRVGFFQNAFRRIVEKELELPSYQKFLNDLDAADMLICPKHGNEKAIQKKIGGQNKKVYLFKTGVLVSPADSEDAESADEPA